MTNRTDDSPRQYAAPLSEKTEEELLLSIRRKRDDSAACREELRSRGWSDIHINQHAA